MNELPKRPGTRPIFHSTVVTPLTNHPLSSDSIALQASPTEVVGADSPSGKLVFSLDC
jgi:hypothetical protein